MTFPLRKGQYFSTPSTAPNGVSSGLTVRQLHELLSSQAEPPQIDPREVKEGRYGPSTRAAVLSVQSASGRPLTGVVDAKEWQALGRKPKPTIPPAAQDEGVQGREQ